MIQCAGGMSTWCGNDGGGEEVFGAVGCLTNVRYFAREFAGRVTGDGPRFSQSKDSLMGSGRPVFEPPTVVINPRMAIDYWLGWSLLISCT